jgi:hypothetical protein
MNVQTRVKNIEKKILQMGLEGGYFIAFSKPPNPQLLNEDGSKFVKPEGFNEHKDVIVVIDWALRQPKLI